MKARMEARKILEITNVTAHKESFERLIVVARVEGYEGCGYIKYTHCLGNVAVGNTYYINDQVIITYGCDRQGDGGKDNDSNLYNFIKKTGKIPEKSKRMA